jgi:predicted phosphodiesterase
MDKQPVCIFTSDLHFSDRQPPCRGEKDWLLYQQGVMEWLSDLCEQEAVPLVAVGDIFDRSRHTNELVNLVIDNMPFTYCTSGNHDVQYHNREYVRKSAYGNFIRSEKAIELNSILKLTEKINLHPYHFGERSGTCNKKDGSFNIALIHELVWENEPFKDADKQGNVEEVVKRFQGFDMIIAGDNHEKFITEVDGVVIVNNGSLMRIKSNQIDYQPSVYILYDDCSIEMVDVPVDDDIISTDHIDSKKEVKNKIALVDLKNQKQKNKYHSKKH